MNLLKDIFDRGARKNAVPVTTGNYLTLFISVATLVTTFSSGLLNFLAHYSGAFPVLIKLIPLVVLIVLAILSIQAVTKKKPEEGGPVYAWSNLVRQCAKVFALLSVVALVYTSLAVFERLQPIKQPLVVFFRTVDGRLVGNLDVRILDGSKKDITEGYAETDTEKGMVMLMSKKNIDLSCYLYALPDGKPVYIPLDEARKVDTLVYGLNAYEIILQTK